MTEVLEFERLYPAATVINKMLCSFAVTQVLVSSLSVLRKL